MIGRVISVALVIAGVVALVVGVWLLHDWITQRAGDQFAVLGGGAVIAALQFFGLSAIVHYLSAAVAELQSGNTARAESNKALQWIIDNWTTRP